MILTLVRPIFYLLLPLLGFFSASQVDQDPIRFFQTSTIPFNWDNLDGDTLYFDDSLSGHEFYLIKSSGIPLYYAQDLSTEVCFDNKCRPLFTTIYWNITGRYLGFVLPEEEFFSRKDHDPFTTEDYVQLHALLADPFLPFAGISFEELIQPSISENDMVDGISSATTKNISPYVVEGAAYTTYTLWNSIYGHLQERIKDLTESQLTPSLLTLILKSASSEDKICGLKSIYKFKQLDPAIEHEILASIAGDDFFVAHTTINEILPDHLKSESLQVGLISKYREVNANLRRPIMRKLERAPLIFPSVINQTRDLLQGLNGKDLESVLELYKKHSINDRETLEVVAKILDHQNPFLAGKAYAFLKNSVIEDDGLSQAIKAYEVNR